jgi:hypothetical protein
MLVICQLRVIGMLFLSAVYHSTMITLAIAKIINITPIAANDGNGKKFQVKIEIITHATARLPTAA